MGMFGVNRNPFSLAQWHSENGGKHLPLIRALGILCLPGADCQQIRFGGMPRHNHDKFFLVFWSMLHD